MIEVQRPKWEKIQELKPELAHSRSKGSPSTRNWRDKSPAPINTDVDTLPEFATREPSRYAYSSGPTGSRSSRSSAEFLLSPEPITPLTASALHVPPAQRSRRSSRAASPNQPSPVSSKRTSSAYPEDKKIFFTDESDLELSEAAVRLQPRVRSSRYSFTNAELPSKAVRTPTHTSNSSSDESINAKISKLRGSRFNSPPRSPQSSRPTTPTPDNVRPTAPPRTPSSALPYEQTANLTPPSVSGSAQRSVPQNVTSQPSREPYPYSPPQSPKLGPSQVAPSPREGRSRPGSRQNSRPTTPLSVAGDVIPSVALFDAVNAKLESRATFPQDRTRGPSRLSSSMRSESIPTPPGPRIDIYSPSPSRMSKSPLPYPDDDAVHLMPSEAAYQFRHPSAPVNQAPEPRSRSPAATPVPAENLRKSPLQRPTFGSRHTLTEGVPQSKNDRLSSPVSPSLGSPTDARLDTVSRPTTPVPAPPASCPRNKSSSKYDDWFTLTNDATFNICPECLATTVGPTPFHGYFVRAIREPGERIRCDFSRPWVRLAWLLTLKQRRPDLDLVYAVSSISNFEDECPADEEVKMSWYGLVDHNDDAIPDFYICGRDRRYLEALFPSLKDCLMRVSRQAHCCSLDRGAPTFAQYLDRLVEIDEMARRSKRSPDLKQFADLVQQTMITKNLPPCKGDKLSRGANWHFIPGVPEFTVCSKCFHEAVNPHIRSSTRTSPVTSSVSLPDQFIRTPQAVPRENGLTRGMGSSCQLYSPRMRRIWVNAVADNDEKYLAKKVRERKAVEMGTYETYATLEKMMKGEEWDRAFVKEELDRVKKEWKEVE
ncbi:hypothetical protein NA57DRAFT_75528 [Rhizodiscina lignyota]|uniref:Uncharacterized protein n=1 Tax=Rhizodiscina lignyota TaxID=1504668 RepID=A0A9P4IEC1_9PEZI|nr:hypothetical protein NA57DRAFT_75528 [Rhizodiscina lignyota]